jgi:hypothetical protein
LLFREINAEQSVQRNEMNNSAIVHLRELKLAGNAVPDILVAGGRALKLETPARTF